MISLWTDEYFYAFLEELSEDSLREPSKICQAFTESETATVGLGGPENPQGMRDINPAKFSAWSEGERKSHYPRSIERKIRNANLQLGMVTPQRAKVYGFNHGKWKKAMDRAMTADLNEMSKVGRELASVLEKGNTVQITAENGTRLNFEIAGRAVHIDDGIIDKEDMAKESFDAQLPAGSILTTVIETSGEGHVIFDLPVQLQGSNIEGLEWVFEKGKLTSITGKKNVEVVSKSIEKATGDNNRIAFLGIGLNPKAEYGYLMDNIVEGAISIGIGDNEALGGKNKSSSGAGASLGRATVEIDGRAIIKDGKLLVKPA
jgi:leucyl aminopeptidase (aminopeptidase T)